MNRVIEKWFAPWRQSTRVWQPPILDLERIWFHSLPCIFVVGMTPYQLINCCGWFLYHGADQQMTVTHQWTSEKFLKVLALGRCFQSQTQWIHAVTHSWWRHQMETFFRVTGPFWGEFIGPGEFPAQRPVTRSFDVFFDLRLNKRLSKQLWGWWLETPSWSLWRHCNVWSVSYVDVTQHNITITALKGQ